MITNLAPKRDFKVDNEYRNLMTRIIGFLLISPLLPPLHKELINLSEPERRNKIVEQHYKGVEGSKPVGISADHPTTEDLLTWEKKDHTRKAEMKNEKGQTHLGSVQTAILWNKNQLDVLQGDVKQVLFSSDFSTGKTLLSKTKALALANKLRGQVKDKVKNEPGEEEQVFFVSLAKIWKSEVCFKDNSMECFQMKN
jgi:hypothetical protein